MFAPLTLKPKAPSAKANSGRLKTSAPQSSTPVTPRVTSGRSWDFSKIPLFPSGRASTSRIQPKLVVGEVHDPLEHEADRVADQVMRMPGPDTSVDPPPQPSIPAIAGDAASPPAGLQRKCACEQDDEQDKHQDRLQRQAEPSASSGVANARDLPSAPPIVPRALESSGAPLDRDAQAFFGPRFGYDFSRVRVHADNVAAQSATAIGAAAYTFGEHIAFGTGRYAPGTTTGRRLLAHELAHVVQQRDNGGQIQRQGAGCATSFSKAGSFQAMIGLVKAAEAKLAAAGITSPKDQIHALRGVYYGTASSLDFSVEKSTTRNEGFNRFTRPSQDPTTSVPADLTGILDCGLFKALQDSQDLIDPGGRQVDFGHLLIALDARSDPAFAGNIKYPAKIGPFTKDIDLGGTGTELVTWIGDLGGGAGSLAVKRVAAPSTNVSTVFRGSDYGGSINLEGDIAGSVIATGSPSAVTAPAFAPGKGLSDILQDYLSPAAPGPSWNNRATTFLRMNGGTFDASGALTNRTALIDSFQKKIQEFACNYIASRVKDGKMSGADARKAASTHVVSSAQEVATVFVDALIDSQKSGGKIEATRFPAPSAGGAGACTLQVGAASLLSL